MKRGSREIGNGEGISIIASRVVRHRYRIFQTVRPVVVAKPVDERKKFGSGSEHLVSHASAWEMTSWGLNAEPIILFAVPIEIGGGGDRFCL
jgi:hypothetical protein